jgi:hypothetical protein
VSAAIQIDRLSLRVPGAEAELGARLAQLVAQRLAPPLALGAGDAAFARLQMELAARPGEGEESLAARIANHLAAVISDALGAGR